MSPVLNDKLIYQIIKHLDDTNTSGYLNDMKHIQHVKEQQAKAEARKRRRRGY